MHNRTMVTIQMENKFAPVRNGHGAILRTQDGFAGEIYVQLTPGTPKEPGTCDGGLLARSNVGQTGGAALDQILQRLESPSAGLSAPGKQQLGRRDHKGQ